MLITLGLLFAFAPVSAQNPFTSKAPPPEQVSPPKPPNPVLAKIAYWQRLLHQKIVALTREAKETGSFAPLLPLIFLAFSYGMLHAAGPGHGKAVAVSYLISSGKSLGRGILFGNMVAFFHGLSAVCLVLVLRHILQKRVSGSLESVSHTTQIISYSLIALMGGVLLLRSILAWHRGNRASETTRPAEDRHRGPLATALAVGMIPCPGVVLVMLFSLSMNMPGLGLLLGFSMTTGMALTISAIVGLAVLGRHLTLESVRNREKLSHIIEPLLETLAALMVMLLGLTFLIAIL